MAVFTHGRLESLDPIVELVPDSYRCLGEPGQVQRMTSQA
jgi:hypothetical protein